MKIAVLGTEPMSQGLAPWGTPGWKFWGCSYQNAINGSEFHEFFELHSVDRLLATYGRKKVSEWLGSLTAKDPAKCKLWVSKEDSRIPNGKLLDKEPLIEMFGNLNFTSSPAWMLGEAGRRIVEAKEEKTSEIALFGIDMTCVEEYLIQRPGMQNLIRDVQKLGIKVWAPPESDIMQPPPLYGFREHDPFYRKALMRRAQVAAEVRQIEEERRNVELKEQGAKCVREIMDYHVTVWGGLRGGTIV